MINDTFNFYYPSIPSFLLMHQRFNKCLRGQVVNGKWLEVEGDGVQDLRWAVFFGWVSFYLIFPSVLYPPPSVDGGNGSTLFSPENSQKRRFAPRSEEPVDLHSKDEFKVIFFWSIGSCDHRRSPLPGHKMTPVWSFTYIGLGEKKRVYEWLKNGSSNHHHRESGPVGSVRLFLLFR